MLQGEEENNTFEIPPGETAYGPGITMYAGEYEIDTHLDVETRVEKIMEENM